MKIILNNKKIIDGILETNVIPEDISIKSVITMMSKLYHSNYINNKDDEYVNEYLCIVDYNKEERKDRKKNHKQFKPSMKCYKEEFDWLVNEIKSTLKGFNLSVDRYEEYKYDTYIKNECAFTIGFNRKLREIEDIRIDKSESNYINNIAKNDNEKKLLFTMFCICKSQCDNGYVNTEYISDTELFKSANVCGTKDKKYNMLYELEKREVVKSSFNGFYILEYNDIEKKDEDDFVITQFENLGNTFLDKYKDGYKKCEVCGKLIKMKSNRQKYCKICSKEVKKEIVNELRRKK